MRLSGEFTVQAPLEPTWDALLDVERIARCLPGLVLEPVGEDGAYRLHGRAPTQPAGTGYAGTVRLADLDSDRHSASFAARANELSGTGTARAVIHHRARRSGDGTQVTVLAELDLTGRAASVEPEMIERGARRLLADFAGRLEPLVLEQHRRAGPDLEAPPRGTGDDGAVRRGPRIAWPAAAGGLLALVLLVATARRRVRKRSWRPRR